MRQSWIFTPLLLLCCLDSVTLAKGPCPGRACIVPHLDLTGSVWQILQLLISASWGWLSCKARFSSTEAALPQIKRNSCCCIPRLSPWISTPPGIPLPSPHQAIQKSITDFILAIEPWQWWLPFLQQGYFPSRLKELFILPLNKINICISWWCPFVLQFCSSATSL